MTVWDDEEIFLLQELGYLEKNLIIPDINTAAESDKALFVIHLEAARHVFMKDTEGTDLGFREFP